jgi:hypothetical protein
MVPSLRGDGAFSIKAADSAVVLTLLPDPQGSYRFSAEVRHEDATRQLGQVGLCFLHSRPASPEGFQHCFCTLTFSDREALFPNPQNKQPSARVSLAVRRIPEGGADDRLSPLFLQHFVPAVVAAPDSYPWRPLAVEVRPEGVDLFWEGRPLASTSHEQILKGFATLKLKRLNNRTVDLFPTLYPAFAPRDALGLYVQYGQASFRRVRIEPLP